MALPPELAAALDAVAETAHLLVASDFDGTLAPIVDDPADARPLPGAAAALTELSELANTSATLISGRALSVLRELSAAPLSVHLVGSHGAEFDTGFAHDLDTELLQRITAELDEIAKDRPGVSVETKPASVALHVRNASATDADAALAAARTASNGWQAHTTEGKSVIEFAVVVTDKGEALDVLRGQTGATAVVFFGDDVTDEKAFRRMHDADVGVKVGPGETLAQYRIESPADVADALNQLLTRRRDER